MKNGLPGCVTSHYTLTRESTSLAPGASIQSVVAFLYIIQTTQEFLDGFCTCSVYRIVHGCTPPTLPLHSTTPHFLLINKRSSFLSLPWLMHAQINHHYKSAHVEIRLPFVKDPPSPPHPTPHLNSNWPSLSLLHLSSLPAPHRSNKETPQDTKPRP